MGVVVVQLARKRVLPRRLLARKSMNFVRCVCVCVLGNVHVLTHKLAF